MRLSRTSALSILRPPADHHQHRSDATFIFVRNLISRNLWHLCASIAAVARPRTSWLCSAQQAQWMPQCEAAPVFLHDL